MEKPDNCIITIFGASGDLTRRKLIPALFALFTENHMPDKFAILGVSRSELTDEDFREGMGKGVKEFSGVKSENDDHLNNFLKNLHYESIQTAETKEYEKVKVRLSEIARNLEIQENVLYYLSTPPELYSIISDNLNAHGLNQQDKRGMWRRIIVEKPFGRDLESARDLNAQLQNIFEENQIYRIDHYLGKETVQNIIALRFSNGVFEPLWNRNYVDHIEITAAEFIGVGDRGGYYDKAGSLRDMVQNHLLQVLGTIAMEPPALFNANAVRNETVKVLQAIRPIKEGEVEKFVVRGQYVDSMIKGENVKSYRQEKDVDPDSRTETYTALKVFVDNWRWGGVPFYIRTGKRMPTRVTEVVIHFKKTPHHLFTESALCDVSCNQLIIRIQPDEGILLKLGMKLPGAGFKIQNVNMDFHYSDFGDSPLPSAYERLLLDGMLGDATLYARSDAVEAGWEFVTPILEAWESNPELKIYSYPAGTWGPKEAVNLFEEPGGDWRYPCRNLVNDGLYCEL
jgi:glucose-6-phosphate 1-dehydrogenase